MRIVSFSQRVRLARRSILHRKITKAIVIVTPSAIAEARITANMSPTFL